MDRFIKELMVGDVHLRDKWQIELKSEFIPNPKLNKNVFTQEFFFFIPNSLQINEDTYPREQFYRDRTNFLRYKTPEFTLSELNDLKNQQSPLSVLNVLIGRYECEEAYLEAEDELKLFGNIVRSSIRERVKELVEQVRSNSPLDHKTSKLCQEIELLRETFFKLKNKYKKKWKNERLVSYFLYADEFFSTTVNYYLTGLLSEIRDRIPDVPLRITEPICQLLEKERQYRKDVLKEPSITDEDSESNEYILYRSSLLNKFILDALLLNTSSHTVKKRFGHLIGSISAGVAMLFFFVLFVFQGQVLIINSLPFILLTVFLYILKDRIKESFRQSTFKRLSRWFYNYSTIIVSPDKTKNLGKLNETVYFAEEENLPEEISKIRNLEFHNVLETIKRPEKVIYYKKVLTLYNNKDHDHARRHALNLIFRYNINRFLNKADNPTHDYLKVDPVSFKFIRATLPKVYHVNVIIRNTFLDKDQNNTVELKKFRLIIDKNGIKRIEHPKKYKQKEFQDPNVSED